LGNNFNDRKQSILKFLAQDFRRVPDAIPASGTYRSEIKVINFWTNWVEAVRFTCEAQNVISLRLMLLASGDRGSADEVIRMIFEKTDAYAQADMAATQAFADGYGIDVAAERAYAPLQRSVHANSLRLSRAAH
jgi:hypothetical protein